MYTLNDELIKGQDWFEDAVEMLNEGIAVTVEVNNYSYDIDLAENYIGGDGSDSDEFISEVLGNVTYVGAENVILKTVDYLLNGNRIEEIYITF
ncbi:gp183 [Bacillus phage W.Ph.]|uniref:Gp183 n=1 Tax=Bacillus phage W.Ph. TaxID=764595 RepID=G9B1T4_9CAUD|nr:gp183 [Bacillus phage W.Ph.]ADH03329.1 gp183 [Bacillus phage W.Ph.]